MDPNQMQPMPDEPRSSLQAAQRLEGDSFEDVLRGEMDHAPWWLVSLAVHAVILFVLALLTISTPTEEEETYKTNLAQDQPPPLEEKKVDIFENKVDTPSDLPPVEDPVVNTDKKESDHNETANDEDFQEAKGDPNQLSDKNLDSDNVFDAVGVGGGAGGAFGGRFGGREDLAARGGGGTRTEGAVLAGLKWLADHQNEDGSWDSDGFTEHCPSGYAGCQGSGEPIVDPGLTGLALLAFLGAGHTHQTGDFRDTVLKGLRYLTSIQGPDGCLGPKDISPHRWIYNHAICTLAIAEAYALTESPLFKAKAQQAIDFVEYCQNVDENGNRMAWRYGEKPGDNDTSVTGWMVMALKSAKAGGLKVSDDCFEGALSWIDYVTDDTYGKAGYTEPGVGSAVTEDNAHFDQTECMTAVAVLCRIFLGQDPKGTPQITNGAMLLRDDLPAWEENRQDFYYWYYGTLAMFQVDAPNGPNWTAWNEAMKTAIVDHQHEGDEHNKGSWDPISKWSGSGGRVYATAINVLCLEVYYRYAKVFGAR